MSEKTDDIIELKINSRTWLKETEDLFDFETSNTSANEYNITNFDKEYFIIKQKILSDKATKVLGVIKYNKLKSNITIINSFKSRKLNNYKNIYKPEHCDRLYELFPLDEFMNINEGDIIKLGKIRIKFDKISFKSKNKSLFEIIQQESPKDLITEPNFDSNNATTNRIMITSLGNSASLINNEIKSKIICRLCYLDESTITDPLISPCNCSGTMKYIHLSCLKKSIKSKYNKKSTDSLEMFLFQNYACEICLTPYPKCLVYKTNVYYLIDIDLNKFENYVLCDLSKYTENNSTKSKQITHFGYIMFKIEDNKELTLGRKKNNDIKLKDISVSRNHCVIIKKDDNLLIKDLGSKFGTMKYIKDSLDLKLKEQITLLCGRHQIELTLDKSWSLFGASGMFDFMCCSCKQPINDNAELIMTKQTNNNENDIIEDINNEEIKDKTLIKKFDYLNKFKDNDSYNDYIIKLDTIFKDNSLMDKNNEDNDEDEKEILNSQIKDKDESFTNY